MATEKLYATMLELQAEQNAILPAAMGRLVHAMFLTLIKDIDSSLFWKLHSDDHPRPFTLSLLQGGLHKEQQIFLHHTQCYHLRLTLLDGGEIWEQLRTYFLEAGPIVMTLGKAVLRLTRICSTPTPDGWIGSTDWDTLATVASSRTISMTFISPTAFSLGSRQFELFPKPIHVWNSLLRSWNNHAPSQFKLEKEAIRHAVESHVGVVNAQIKTITLHFPGYTQKGFLGICTYVMPDNTYISSALTSLAMLAPYAGIGYRTPMGMGQTQVSLASPLVESISADVTPPILETDGLLEKPTKLLSYECSE